MTRKEAWPFYRTISDVRLCRELEKPKGPKIDSLKPSRRGRHVDTARARLGRLTSWGVQGYLAHKNQPPLEGHHRALGMVVQLGPRGWQFLMSEMSLYEGPPGWPVLARCGRAVRSYRGTSLIRNRHPVGPYSRTMPRLIWRA